MFYSYTPTKLMNGIGALERIVFELGSYQNILIIHGNSIINFLELNSVVENLALHKKISFYRIPLGDPKISDIAVASKLTDEGRPLLLAIGGGRVIDFTKALAVYAGNKFKNDEIFTTNPLEWSNTLKIATIATRPGSGSELNNAFILSNSEGWKKSLFSLSTYPLFSIHDPIFFSTLNAKDFYFGLLDALIHALDQYIVERADSLVVDELSLAYIKILGGLANAAINHKKLNFQQLAWVGSMISSGILTRGVSASWYCHELAHALASRVNLNHGESLALIADSVFHLKCASLNRYRLALNALSEGFGHTSNLTSIGEFIEQILLGIPVQKNSSINIELLSEELRQECPNYTKDLITEILRRSINAK